MALIHAVVSIRYRADQIVSGVAINIFAAGITVFLLNRFYGLADVGQVSSSNALPNWNVPLLGQVLHCARHAIQKERLRLCFAAMPIGNGDQLVSLWDNYRSE